MIVREMSQACLSLAKQYPVLTFTGPRQSGKTTLVKHLFADKPYINLEDPEVRLAAKADPRGLLSRYPEGMILDEIQRVPELLSYIQVIVDDSQQKGQFILTGSHQFSLHQARSLWQGTPHF